MRWRAVRLFGLLKTRPLETASLMLELLSSLYQHWVRANQKDLFRAKDLATPLRNQLPGGLKSLLQVFTTPSWWLHPCFYTNTVADLLVFMCKCPDGKAQRHSSAPTEAGSALGPDWHEGLVLQGAEQVTFVTGLLSVCLQTRRLGWKLSTSHSFVFSIILVGEIIIYLDNFPFWVSSLKTGVSWFLFLKEI